MADILLDNEALPTTPAASKSILFVDSVTKKLAQLDDSGNAHGMLSGAFPPSGTASQTTAAADTYITNSGILVPNIGLQVGMLFRWIIDLFKATNAGTATPVYTIRAGTGVIGDTSLLALTGIAQTAATGGGIVIVMAYVRTIGASAVIAGNFTAPGVTLGVGQLATTVSSTFNSTTTTAAGTLIGLSVNSGASTTYTIDFVRGELIA